MFIEYNQNNHFSDYSRNYLKLQNDVIVYANTYIEFIRMISDISVMINDRKVIKSEK